MKAVRRGAGLGRRVASGVVRALLRLRLRRAAPFTGAQTTLLWAGLVGFLGALASLAFREAIAWMQLLLTGGEEGLVQAARALPPLRRLVLPALGGAGAGAVMMVATRFARGQPATDFLEAIVLGNGVMPVRPILARCSSALLSIASGGAMGREGPMVQLSGMVGSVLGQRLGLSPTRLRLLVACGVAAGIASAYRAPIAGSLFVAEIVLGSIAMESFGPLVFAAVVANLTVRQVGERGPLYNAVGLQLVSAWEIVPFLMVGLLAGLLAPPFLRALATSRRLFGRLFAPPYLRLAAGGSVVGALSLRWPEVWGNGTSTVSELLHTPPSFADVAQLSLAKLLAVLATVGSGAVGGVFTPTLCLGASLGALFARAYHWEWHEAVPAAAAYALVGMGSFLAATTHAPLMAILMIFEMTLDYDMVMPLMLACVTAFYVARAAGGSSIYRESLPRRSAQAVPLGALSGGTHGQVAEVLRQSSPTVSYAAPFAKVARQFVKSSAEEVYVLDGVGSLMGYVTLDDVREVLDEVYPINLVRADDIMHQSDSTLTPDVPLTEAARLFLLHPHSSLPVVADAACTRFLGTVERSDVALALAHEAH